MNKIEPLKLNNTWTAAARLEANEPPRAANIAVMVVQMLLPNRNGRAIAKVIEPAPYIF